MPDLRVVDVRVDQPGAAPRYPARAAGCGGATHATRRTHLTSRTTIAVLNVVGAVINVAVIRRATKRLREAQDRDRERRLMARRDVDTDLSTWDSLRDQFRSTDHTSISTAFYMIPVSIALAVWGLVIASSSPQEMKIGGTMFVIGTANAVGNAVWAIQASKRLREPRHDHSE